jgi:hypothetical protein
MNNHTPARGIANKGLSGNHTLPVNIKELSATNKGSIQCNKCNDNFGLHRISYIFVAIFKTNGKLHTSESQLAKFHLE